MWGRKGVRGGGEGSLSFFPSFFYVIGYALHTGYTIILYNHVRCLPSDGKVDAVTFGTGTGGTLAGWCSCTGMGIAQ